MPDCDRALIGLMVYSFARIGAALGMTVEDVYTQNRRVWVRLRKKGGKRHAMPCHHNLEEYLVAYLDGAGLRNDPKGPLFRNGSVLISARLPAVCCWRAGRRPVIRRQLASPL
jgi:integrase